MVRTKKSDKAPQLPTLDEKLESAIVPVEVQPYEVPENWVWTTLSCCLIPCKERTEDFFNKDIKYVGLDDMEKNGGGIVSYGSVDNIKSQKNVFKEGQLLYGKLRPYLNKHGVATFNGVCSTDILVFDLKETAYNKFINHFFDIDYFIEYTVANSTGDRPRVSEQIILEAYLPLPPLVEQTRIVSIIETLFSQLDEAQAKAQAVVDGFEDRKAAILHRAFTGELTAKWREENGVDRESWEDKALGSCLYPMQTRNPSGNLFRYIDIDSIDNEKQEVREPKVIKSSEAPSRAKRAVVADDILFSMVRPYLRNIAMVREEYSDCIASTGFYVCRCKSVILPRFLYEYLRSKDAIDYLMQFMKGDNSPSIRKDDLLEMRMSLPSTAEQLEICNVLRSVLQNEREVKETAEQVISQIDVIKKSILARAFRGELGTNDPTDESATELLKRILEQS